MGHWLLHFLGLDSASGTAYLALSGVVGDLGLFATAIAVTVHAVIGYRHKNCEVHRCPRVAHRTTAAGHRVCGRHAPDSAPTHAEVIAAHHAAKLTRPPKRLARTQETGTTGNARPGGPDASQQAIHRRQR